MTRSDPAAGDERLARGLEQRRRVLGGTHVEHALQRASAVDAPFQAHITRAVWGDVWGRETLALRERRLLTLALLAALGHEGELALHVRAAVTDGVEPHEIAEVMLHTSVYAGVPAANSALATVRSVLSEMGHPDAEALGDPARVLADEPRSGDDRSGEGTMEGNERHD